MVKKPLLLVIFALLGLATYASQASTIHVRYFESADFFLIGERFQLYSFAALEGETITLVVYGLDAELSPAVSVFDINGMTIAEDINSEQDDVAVVEVTAPANGLYTALVSRQTETGGLVRVMLFEGEPLSSDLSVLDTIDPLLPSRAYFAQGDSENPISMTVTVLDDENEETPLPQIFASRGTEVEAPPLEERVSAIERFTWRNNDGTIFYTLNVRSLPEEQLPTSRKVGGFLSASAQFLDLATIRLDIGQATEDPDFLPRPQCTGNVVGGAALLAGPGEQFIETGQIAQRTNVEIVGSHSTFWLVLDPESPVGGSFIPKSEVQLTASDEDCARATLEVVAPDETPDNTQPTTPPPSSSGGNRPGGASNNPFGSLLPDGGNPGDGPNPNPDVVRLPPSPSLPDPNVNGFPSVGCILIVGGLFGDFAGSYALPNGVTIYSDASCTTIAGINPVNKVYAPSGFDPVALCATAFGASGAVFSAGDVYTCI
jgi:hypothetical protein